MKHFFKSIFLKIYKYIFEENLDVPSCWLGHFAARGGACGAHKGGWAGQAAARGGWSGDGHRRQPSRRFTEQRDAADDPCHTPTAAAQRLKAG